MSKLQEIIEAYGLPELPEIIEDHELDGDTRELVIYRQSLSDENIPLAYVSVTDAREYCSREDTHGDGWFVGSREL